MDAEGLSLGEGVIIGKTEKAILVKLEGDKELWIPKSVVHDDSEVWSDGTEGQNEGDVVVAKWWAEKNGHG